MKYLQFFFILFTIIAKIDYYLDIVLYYDITKYMNILKYLNIARRNFKSIKLRKETKVRKCQKNYLKKFLMIFSF